MVDPPKVQTAIQEAVGSLAACHFWGRGGVLGCLVVERKGCTITIKIAGRDLVALLASIHRLDCRGAACAAGP